MYLKVIIVVIIFIILYILISNTPITNESENNSDRPLQKIYLAKNNLAQVDCSYNIYNKRSVNSMISQKPIDKITIEDNVLDKPSKTKPFKISGNVNVKHNLYVPPLNQYDVQSGLYDNNPLPKPKIFKPIGVEVKNRVDLDSDNSNKYIHEIYDDLLNDRPVTNREVDTNNYKIIPAYKGYSLEMDNWNYYKNEDYANGGAYNNLIGVENNIKSTQRVIDGYNDFELKEWI